MNELQKIIEEMRDTAEQHWCRGTLQGIRFLEYASRLATIADQQPVAWATHHDEPMLFPTKAEADAYCRGDEEPIPLYALPTDSGGE